MSENTFKLKGGEATYDSFYDAVQVAEARAEQTDRSVIVCRKLVHTYEDVVKVFPDGDQERLSDFTP